MLAANYDMRLTPVMLIDRHEVTNDIEVCSLYQMHAQLSIFATLEYRRKSKNLEDLAS